MFRTWLEHIHISYVPSLPFVLASKVLHTQPHFYPTISTHRTHIVNVRIHSSREFKRSKGSIHEISIDDSDAMALACVYSESEYILRHTSTQWSRNSCVLSGTPTLLGSWRESISAQVPHRGFRLDEVRTELRVGTHQTYFFSGKTIITPPGLLFNLSPPNIHQTSFVKKTKPLCSVYKGSYLVTILFTSFPKHLGFDSNCLHPFELGRHRKNGFLVSPLAQLNSEVQKLTISRAILGFPRMGGS